MAVLDFEGYAKTENDRFDLAVNSLVLYTDAGYKISLGIAECMMWLALAELLYTLYIYLFGGYPVEGWTTTMFVLTVGFAGVFAILSIIIKYLSLLVVKRHEKTARNFESRSQRPGFLAGRSFAVPCAHRAYPLSDVLHMGGRRTAGR